MILLHPIRKPQNVESCLPRLAKAEMINWKLAKARGRLRVESLRFPHLKLLPLSFQTSVLLPLHQQLSKPPSVLLPLILCRSEGLPKLPPRLSYARCFPLKLLAELLLEPHDRSLHRQLSAAFMPQISQTFPLQFPRTNALRPRQLPFLIKSRHFCFQQKATKRRLRYSQEKWFFLLTVEHWQSSCCAHWRPACPLHPSVTPGKCLALEAINLRPLPVPPLFKLQEPPFPFNDLIKFQSHHSMNKVLPSSAPAVNETRLTGL
jgi:hypothetical protein